MSQGTRGTSNVSGDEWYVTIAVMSGVMPLLHQYFVKFKSLSKMRKKENDSSAKRINSTDLGIEPRFPLVF